MKRDLVITAAYAIILLFDVVYGATYVAAADASSEEFLSAEVIENSHQTAFSDESEIPVVEPAIGISISGGGSRSLICAVGGFRAFHSSNEVINEVDYLSSVSGGTWFSSIYMFQKKYNDTELLGQETSPSQLTMDFLSNNDPGELAKTLLKRSDKVAIRLVLQGTPLQKLWQSAIGQIFLRPFGLSKDKYMAASQLQVTKILEKNPTLSRLNFVVQPENRPKYYTIGSTLEAPLLYRTDESNVAYLKISPSYTGNSYGNTNSTAQTTNGEVTYNPAFKWCDLFDLILDWIKNWAAQYNLTFSDAKKSLMVSLDPVEQEQLEPLFAGITSPSSECPKSTNNLPPLTVNIGGGLLETFAFGGEKAKDNQNVYGINNVTRPESPFSLGQAAGASSAAYTDTFGSFDTLQALVPREKYFSIGEGEQVTTPHQLGDGGNLENTGVITQVRDGVKKIIAFINTRNEVANISEVDLCDAATYENASSDQIYSWGIPQVANMFGYYSESGNGWYMYNQIFKQQKYQEFLCEAQTLITEGKPVVITHTYELVDNSFWGTKAGVEPVDIVWIVNAKCTDFEEQLPADTKAALNGPTFPNYPYYPTMMTNGIQVTTMTNPQINLLAAQTQYAVSENIQKIKAFLNI